MDDFRPKKYIDHTKRKDNASLVVVKSKKPVVYKTTKSSTVKKVKKINLKITIPRVSPKIRKFYADHQLPVRIFAGFMATLIIFSVGFELNSAIFNVKKYQLSSASTSLIGETKSTYASKLQYNKQQQKFSYNADYKPSSDVTGQVAGPKFSADFYEDSTKGVAVTDPVSQTTVTMKPKFGIDSPVQSKDRLVYPVQGKPGAVVYTLGVSGFKEDIVLEKYTQNKLQFDYVLDLPKGTEARIDQDGSLGVYGVQSSLLGQVQTGSEKDAKLLDKARESGAKNNLLFRIPAPFVRQTGKPNETTKSWFELRNNVLSVYADNLKHASYPISVDPSVYIESASNFMRGNNETNIDFDTSNELIQKGKTTGARIPSWSTTSSTQLPVARWNQGTAVAGGYVYIVGGSNGTTTQSTVYWAKFNTTTGTIDPPNPGAGACANWCTSSAYNLPAARAGLSVVAYNGFLYAIGGVDGAGARTNTV